MQDFLLIQNDFVKIKRRRNVSDVCLVRGFEEAQRVL